MQVFRLMMIFCQGSGGTSSIVGGGIKSTEEAYAPLIVRYIVTRHFVPKAFILQRPKIPTKALPVITLIVGPTSAKGAMLDMHCNIGSGCTRVSRHSPKESISKVRKR